MPTVPASNLPYTGVPTAEPQVGVPSRYQTERATPEDFGAGVGASLIALGGQIGRTSDVLAENAIRIQDQHNHVAADDLTNQYQDFETKLLYGDPNSPGDTGFFGKKGQDALNAMPQVRDALLKQREQMRGALQNDRQKILFDGETRRLQAVTLSNIGRHFVAESNTYQTQVAEAKVKSGLTFAAQSIARDDEVGFNEGVRRSMTGFLEDAQRKGLAQSSDYVDQGLQKIRGEAVKYKAESIAEKNPLAAAEFLRNNIDAMNGDEANQLLARYRARAASIQADVDNGFAEPPKQRGNTDKYDGSHLPHFNYGRSGALGDPNEPGWAEKNLTSVQAPSGAAFKVHKAAAQDIAGFLKDLEATGYKIDTSESGGHAHRDIRGGTGLSEHAFGTAIDINPSRNPFSPAGEKVTDLPANVGELAAKHNLEWGGNWTSPVDTMHFQWRGPSGGPTLAAAPDKVDNWEVKHNNFGGLRKPGVQATTAEGGFQSFKTPEEGVQAIVNRLHDYAKGGVTTAMNSSGAPLNTIRGIVTTWAPPNENDTALLIERATKLTGFEPDQQLDMSDPSVMSKMTEAIIRNEHGGKLPVSPTIIENVAGQAPGLAAGAEVAQRANTQPIKLASNDPDQLILPRATKPLPKLDFALPPLESGELPDAQLPGMAEQLEKIMQNVPEDEVERRRNAVKRARQVLNQQYQDQQRALKLHNEQTKAQATLVQDDYLKRMYPGAPNPPSIQEVLTDNKLREHPEVKRTLVSFMERENKTDPAALVSKQNTMQLFAKMNLPDGEAEKITTEEPFNKAYTGQEVTRADRDWLVTQFRTQRSAGGETIKNLKTQIITAAKPTILGPLAAADERLIEPDNAFKLFNFIHAVDEKIKEYEDNHKNPVDLFNPKKPDFVGSDDFLRPFASPMAQRMRQQANERNAVGPAPGPIPPALDITKVPDADLIQGLNSRKYDYNAGVKELERRGYGHRPAPPVR